ncbi:outer membrane biogenesis protein BamB [Caulifigura coniformis]|uniref:Outer membrane biogenesis protein BamB n=1 Tax=Caulifigura coniformis TaxID=2527983 RepID=A0A517SAE1_9PLAN|nr:PQQ-binding-like beta-propeller repeat protein [Caulifigura coniformis]QDT53094.1 outer membrane biogenesis protein BamB [Caulifigura coniformis]
MRTNSLALFLAMTAGLVPVAALADDWPQWSGPKRDAVWRESGIVDRFPEGGPPIRWRVKIGGGYAGPAVAQGRVFVTDRQLKQGASDPSNPFERGAIPATERVLCLDEKDGREIWKHEYDCPYTVSYPAGPRCTPTVDGDRVYTLGSEGHLFCFRVATGEIVWSKQLLKDFERKRSPVWGFAAHPLVHGDKLICLVGGEGTAVVAFDKGTGKELWRAGDSLTDHAPGYCPPMIIEHGEREILLAFYPEGLHALDPETGKSIWFYEWEIQNGLTVPMPRVVGNRIFLTTFYNGSRMLQLSADGGSVSEIWKRKGRSERNTDALHSIMPTPWFDGGLIFGIDSYGELRCLDAANGDRLWMTYDATGGKSDRWANAFLVKHDDRFFIPNEKGDLIVARLDRDGYHELSRAHLIEPTGSAQQRKIVWSHPAFANRSIYLRNDEEIVSASLAK